MRATAGSFRSSVRFADVPADWADRFRPDGFSYRLRQTGGAPREWTGSRTWKDVVLEGSRDVSSQFGALDGVSLTDVSLLSSEAQARVSVLNPFAFPLKIASTEYVLYAEGHEVGNGQTQGMILHPGQKNVLALPIDVDHGALLSAAGGAVLSGGSVAVKLDGRLVLRLKGGDVAVPISLSGHLAGRIVTSGGYASLRLERSGAVARVTLARPEVRNAFDDRLIEELTRAVGEAAKDPDARVVVLAGDGPSFCAGADISWMRKAGGYSRAENEADAERMARMLRTIDACPKPVVALAHGAAIGGGVGLVAAADIAIAAEGTVFSLAEVKLGILPSVISPYVLRAIGPRSGPRPVPDGRPVRRAPRRCGSDSSTASCRRPSSRKPGERRSRRC